MNSFRTRAGAAPAAKRAGGTPRNGRRRNPEREARILEAALQLFGGKGFETTTVSSICEAAGVSEATLYEYFESKEQVLFAIAELYTRREVERLQHLEHYIQDPRERLRAIIQAYLEFYEANPLYTSVALLTLKANRSFIASAAYQAVREAARPIVTAFEQGVADGLFRSDLEAGLVRNMVLGFIEHLTTQWIVTGRPEGISRYRDTIHQMVMRAIELPGEAAGPVVRIEIRDARARVISDEPDG
jgi:AcrR family transcriptional regulator